MKKIYDKIILPLVVVAATSIFANSVSAQITTSQWRASVLAPNSNNPQGLIEVRIDGADFVPFQVRGIGYQPTPMRANPDFARWNSDTWWDDVRPVGQFNPMGDKFSPASDHVTHGYSTLWGTGNDLVPGREDIRMIKETFQANTIRIYGMTSRLRAVRENQGIFEPYTPPQNAWNPPDQVGDITYVKHDHFLDELADHDIFVLVGLFLGTEFWDKRVHDLPAKQLDVAWWTAVYREVVKEVGNHPAVMGFIVNNEVDGTDIVYKDPELAEFFWNQMRTITADIKAMAPDKLVGVAFHNDTTFGRHASAQMSDVPNLDFWGLNVFEGDEHAVGSIFLIDDDVKLGYQRLPPAALKPVIFTEYGFPQTKHNESLSDCENYLSISDSDATVSQHVANLVRDIGGDLLAGKYSINAGMVYFELTDEFFKQNHALNKMCIVDNPDFPPGDDSSCVWLGTSARIVSNFPGGRWDEAGFGLFAVKRGINPGTNQPEPECADSFGFLPDFDYFGPFVPDRLVSARDEGGDRGSVQNELFKLYSSEFSPSGGTLGAINTTRDFSAFSSGGGTLGAIDTTRGFFEFRPPWARRLGAINTMLFEVLQKHDERIEEFVEDAAAD